jgi:acetyl esterase
VAFHCQIGNELVGSVVAILALFRHHPAMPHPGMMRRMDYRNLIDDATWAFIRATDAAYPPDTASLGIEDQRRIYDKMCRAFFRGYPPGIVAQDDRIAGVPVRTYPGLAPCIVYFHGGGFVVGGLHSHDDVCAEIRARTGLQVVAVDYRLSPEHLHPAAFQDACAVATALGTQGPILLAGDSAGGNLAAATAHALRGSATQILGQVLIYPGLGGDPDQGSYLRHAMAPMLTRDDVLFYKDIRHGAPPPQGDPTVSPLQDTDFSNLPPTFVVSAECDPLCDDGPAYAARLRAAGGHAHAEVAPGLVHGYLRARATVPRAAASFTRICDTLTALSRQDWPWRTDT